MPLAITASPATIENSNLGEVWGYLLFDPNRIERSVAATSLADAQAGFDEFVAGLPDGCWMVSGLWTGSDKAPRGFKAARERGGFTRKLNRTAEAA